MQTPVVETDSTQHKSPIASQLNSPTTPNNTTAIIQGEPEKRYPSKI